MRNIIGKYFSRGLSWKFMLTCAEKYEVLTAFERALDMLKLSRKFKYRQTPWEAYCNHEKPYFLHLLWGKRCFIPLGMPWKNGCAISKHSYHNCNARLMELCKNPASERIGNSILMRPNKTETSVLGCQRPGWYGWTYAYRDFHTTRLG